MSSLLVTVNGSLKGQAFPLGTEPVSIGRDPSNPISPADPFVSQRHCLIECDSAGLFHIEDLGSRNGTFVNGLPIGKRDLRHGDEIRLGQCVFFFIEHQDLEAPEVSSVQLDEDVLRTNTVCELRREDSIYLNPKTNLFPDQPPLRAARDLGILLRIASALPAGGSLDALGQRILKIVFQSIPAARGAVLLFLNGGSEPDWVFGMDRERGANCEVTVPANYARRALETGAAILGSQAEARVEGGFASFLLAPLFLLEKACGVMYLEASDVRVSFEEAHLQLAAAIGILCGPALAEARRFEWLEQENLRLREEIHLEHGMVGESDAIKTVYRFIEKVAPADSSVLIYGESGTGKELVARAIHRNSRRASSPLVAINCAALAEALLESELFGYEKGAFTGAMAQKTGKLEIANGGTVFLDEVGETPLAVQAKLLRAIQEGEFERLGGNRPIKVNVRWIAATNRDLREAVQNAAFRADLYFRLNVVSIRMPPLRERQDDIPLLATHFISKYSRQTGRVLAGMAAKTRMCLLDYNWPGNVRELANAIERAVVLGTSELIYPEDLPDSVVEAAATQELPERSFLHAVRDFKSKLICKAMHDAGGSYTKAAAVLELHPNSLHRLIRTLKLKSENLQSGRE